MKKSKNVLVFLFKKKNSFALTALIGALESKGLLDSINVILVRRISDLDLEQLLLHHNKVIIAWSIKTMQLPEVEKEINLIPTHHKILKMAGGPHVTGDPHSVLNMGFDIAVIGDGEETLIDLVEHEFDNLDEIKGIAWKGGTPRNHVFNPPREPIKLDDYPLYSLEHGLFMSLEITRGCPFHCTFCQVPSKNPLPRHRSLNSILENMRVYASKNLKDFRFITPNAFGYGSTGRKPNVDKFQQFIEEISKIPHDNIYLGTFPSEVRPESVTDEVLEIIKPVVSNDKIAIGLQSGSETILKKVRRGHTVEEGMSAIEKITEHGFQPIVDFIFGFPFETIDDRMESIQVMKKIIKLGGKIRVHAFMPLPGSDLAFTEPSTLDKITFKEIGRMIRDGHANGNFTLQYNSNMKVLKTWRKYMSKEKSMSWPRTYKKLMMSFLLHQIKKNGKTSPEKFKFTSTE